jgi:hypothetical protein
MKAVLRAATRETREVEKVLPEGYVIRILLVSVILSWSLSACSSVSLPKAAQVALDKSVATLAGSELDYKVVSTQKAEGPPEDRIFEPELPSANIVSGCPPDTGDRETWCVVVYPGITSGAGQSYCHFLVRRVGESWSVEELADSEARRFEYIGCDNW